MPDALFVLVLIGAIAFYAAAWWRLIKAMPSLSSSQQETTFLALLANLVALVFPFVYGFPSIFTMSLQRAIRWGYVLIGCWVLRALSLVLSAWSQ